MSAKVIMVVIHVLSSSTMALAQNVSIFPKTPAFVDVNHELSFMCKSSAHEEWRNTLFFDETEDDGLSSVGLFYQNTNGTCIQSIISEQYHAACDIAKGEFNLTIRKIDRQYHDKIISCKTQFGNGTIEDISVTKTVKIYVKVPVSDIILSETEIETNVTSNFTIRCSVISRPAAIIKWIRFNADGLQDDITSFSQVSSNHSIAGDTIMSVLTIKFSKFDNKGHLQCEANNSFSFRQSQDIPLHIYYPPENRPIIRQVKPGPVDSGDTVYLHCSVYGGYPIAKIIWDCQGKIKDQSSDTLSAVILELVIDRSYDDKICSCTATHRDPSYKHTVQHKLIVYFSPSIPKLSTIPAKPWFVGNTTNVLCLSEEGKPKSDFQWSVNGQLKMENNSVLHIGPLTKTDDKIEVFCNVMNEYTTRHGITLTSEPLHLDVEYNPEVKFENNVLELYAVEGENLTVKCLAYGNPKAMVHWEESNIELTVPEDSQSVLYIYRIERHQHLFTCHAVSLSAKYGQLVTSKPIEIEIFYQPNITKIEVQGKTHLPEGQNTSLLCQVDSYPLSNISWRYIYNNTLLIENSNVSKSYLNIASANCLDTGIYQCKAVTNIKGKLYSSTAQTNLNVICGPRSDYRYQSLPSKIAVAFNESLELAVRLVAFPSPLLNWYLRDTKLNFSTYVLGSSVTTTIYVPKIQKTYLGRYTLNAINNAGSHIININVVEKGKPDMPSVLNLSCGSTTAKIVWTVPFDGGDIQKFRVHYWADDSGAQMHKSKYLDDPGEEKSLEYETQGLREKTVYFFQIIASNSLGSSTTTVKCNTTESSQMTTSTKAILAVVSFLCILLMIFLVCYCRKKKVCQITKSSRSSQQICHSNSTYMSQDNVVASSVTLTGDPTTNPNSETDPDGYIVPVGEKFLYSNHIMSRKGYQTSYPNSETDQDGYIVPVGDQTSHSFSVTETSDDYITPIGDQTSNPDSERNPSDNYLEYSALRQSGKSDIRLKPINTVSGYVTNDLQEDVYEDKDDTYVDMSSCRDTAASSTWL